MSLIDYLLGIEKEVKRESEMNQGIPYGEVDMPWMVSDEERGVVREAELIPNNFDAMPSSGRDSVLRESELEMMMKHRYPWQSENTSNNYHAGQMQKAYDYAKQHAPNIPHVNYFDLLGVQPMQPFMPIYRGK